MHDISSDRFVKEKTMYNENYEEMVVHGDLLFHMSVHMTKIPENQKIILYYHWHEELELFFIKKGSARLQINGEFYNVHEGEIVLIKPNELHAAYPINNEEVEFYAVLIHSDFISSFVNDLIQQKYIYPIFSNDLSFTPYISAESESRLKILPLLEDIIRVYQEELPGYELLIKSRIYEIFYKLFTYDDEIRPKPIKNETYKISRLKQIVKYIEENYANDISLPDLASQINMSNSHFCRFFKENLSMTPIEYLNNFRITKAVNLIETTDKKLTEIAFIVGFNNINNFTTMFKKLFHCTPIKYRQNVQSSNKKEKTLKLID